MTNNTDLIAQCFHAINAFKRHRVLGNSKRDEGKSTEAQFHDLKAYQYFDSLELAMRALQKGIYESNNTSKGEVSDVQA